MAQQLLAPVDVNDLMSASLISPVSPDGTRRLHKRRLHGSSDEENSHIPLMSISSPDAATSNAFLTIPDVLISRC